MFDFDECREAVLTLSEGTMGCNGPESWTRRPVPDASYVAIASAGER